MTVTIKILHRGEERNFNAPVSIRDMLIQSGYPEQGHDSWRAWIRGQQVTLGTCVTQDLGEPIIITHIAAGNLKSS